MSSEEVTNSVYFVKYGKTNVCLEFGMYQCQDISKSYSINNKRPPFNVKTCDFVILNHVHIDHIGLIPMLIKYGFNGRIVCPANSKELIKAMLLNSSFICEQEARILTKRKKKLISPLFTSEDVYKILDYIDEYDFNILHILNENISFKFYNNSHCVSSAQLELNLYNENRNKKSILYTSDLGGDSKFNYSNKTEIPNKFFDICIMESTYGNSGRVQSGKKSFNKELEKFKVAIKSTLDNGGSVLIPAFSFSRTPQILTCLYELFYKDEDFKYDIFVDSKLSCQLIDIFKEILTNENLEKYNKVIGWDKVHFIKEKDESKRNIIDSKPKIVLSSSGFCTAGRIINYLQKYLSNIKNLICFCGYIGADESYLSYRIKNFKNNKQIKIGRQLVKNNSQCIAVNFFSSHANYGELVNFAGKQNCDKICLVHGEKSAKEDLKHGIQEELSKNNKTTKVICSQKDMFIRL